MRNQNVPPVDDNIALTEIVDGKRGARNTRLNNIKTKVSQAYVDYITNSGSLGVMSPISLGKTQKKDMEHCYDSKTAGLTNLKTSIKDNLSAVDKELCPYCNLREPGEFDHYLPKSRFQEFSVFSKNLIWSCHKCNHKKKEHFDPADRYLNTYYDAVPNEQFLFCTIGIPIDVNGISFYYQKPSTITATQYKDIVDHSKKLGLLESYKQRASQKLPTWLKTWENLYKHFADANATKRHITTSLQAEINSEETTYGTNHYKVVLKKSILSQIDDIIDQFDDT